jgi:uncharacterized protein GlcG (DUF336 family)
MSITQTAPAVKRAKVGVAVIIAVLIAGGVVVLVMRMFKAGALAAETATHTRQFVTTVMPQAPAGGLPLTLPGTLQGY